MKGIDIFCASQASTAICLSMDQPSSSSSIIQLGGRAIDRHNPIIRDGRRSTRSFPTNPCTSQPPPINPKPYHQLHKSNKKASSSNKPSDQNKKNSAKPSEKEKKSSSSKPSDGPKKSSAKPSDIIRKSCAKPGDLITPPGSSRYLLSDTVFFNGFSDYDPVLALVPVEPKKTQAVSQEESIASKESKPSSSSSGSERPSSDQVVVLRVSLHCRGCEGKVRKHLSKMEGVTSFNIDFLAKKVTIIGDVTPLGVLESVSKVKSAQFWPSTMSSSAASSVASSNQEIIKS